MDHPDAISNKLCLEMMKLGVSEKDIAWWTIFSRSEDGIKEILEKSDMRPEDKARIRRGFHRLEKARKLWEGWEDYANELTFRWLTRISNRSKDDLIELEEIFLREPHSDEMNWIVMSPHHSVLQYITIVHPKDDRYPAIVGLVVTPEEWKQIITLEWV